MTEGEWRASISPVSPLYWLFFDSSASDRKLRLFSLACCRRVAHLVRSPSALQLLDHAEAFAEGRINEVTLRAAHRAEAQKYPPGATVPAPIAVYLLAANDPARDRERGPARYTREQVTPDCVQLVWHLLDAIATRAQPDAHACRRKELVALGQLLHDIFGPLPFRDIAVGPWLTTDVRALVHGIDAEQAFDRMPILADALQDAGCDNDDILTHCRAERWAHVRGCWVVDLLLGRPWQDARPQS